MKLTISQAILKYLEDLGVEYIFGIPSGNTSYIYDSITDSPIKSIVTKHESGATYSAARYSELTNKLGVAFLCGGVGVTNSINGIADAYINKLPMLVISGDSSTKSKGKGAIQELCTIPITESITKYSVNIKNPEDTIKILDHAVNLALTEPCGPVHISLPMDIPILETEYIEPNTNYEKIENDLTAISKAVNVLNKAKKGLILVGRGAKNVNNEINLLADKLNFYIATTPQGKGKVLHSSPYYIGNFGFYSSDFASNYINDNDVDTVLVLGSSLGESSTQNFDVDFYTNKTIIQIDHCTKSLDKKSVENKLAVKYDIKDALDYLIANIDKKSSRVEPIMDKSTLNKKYIQTNNGLSIKEVLDTLPKVLNENTTYLCDIGEFMNYVYKFLYLPDSSKFIGSLNYGSMGAIIGGATGAAIAKQSKCCAVIVGDGSYYMNGMEVLTAKAYNLPIIYFVINNAKYNYVDQGQSFVFGRSLDGIFFNRLDITKVSEAMGIKSFKVSNINDLYNLKDTLYNINEPIVVELITDGNEKIGDCDRFKSVKKSVLK
ncbi:thiamine pyrophosphate-binding protein [Clostridium ihumii]|uniref:thiamine pyrophosphate-binding protein n=1 Tax=Clostridium ihumii TaxID=1470356 RepID=UPI00058EB33C|nr:thiamine pyrophosphate-binding protein [Clostridium ihumii]